MVNPKRQKETKRLNYFKILYYLNFSNFLY